MGDRAVEEWVTYREVIRDTVYEWDQSTEKCQVVCMVSKQDFRALKNLRTDRWNGMDPTYQRAGIGAPLAVYRRGVIENCVITILTQLLWHTLSNIYPEYKLYQQLQ